MQEGDDQDRSLSSRLAAASIRHARWVFVAGLALVLAGAAVATGLGSVLTQSFSLPGQPGYEANQAVVARYGGGGSTAPTVLAVELPAGASVDDPAVTAGLARGSEALRTALAQGGPTVPGAPAGVDQPAPRVAAYRGPQDDALASADEQTTYVLVFAYSFEGSDGSQLGQDVADEFTRASGLPEGTQVHTTGVDVLASSTGGAGESSILAETLIGAGGALVVLAFVFGSFLAIVPLVTAVVSIMTTFILVRALTLVTDVSFIVQFLIALIGLGIAIDYSLLIVTRWREERAQGLGNREAVLASLRTAGHAVVFSGVTVAVGLLALVVLPVPFMRSVGFGGVLIPLVSVVVSLTLLPALLATVGPFLDRPRRRGARPVSAPSRAWTWWARTVIRFRWLAVLAGAAVLALLVASALSLRVGEPETSALEGSGPATTGLHALESAGVGSGALTPIEVLTTPADAETARARAAAVTGVRGVITTGKTASSVVLDVVPDAETSTEAGQQTLDDVQEALSGLQVQVGGVGAGSEAFNDAVYGSFPLMLSIIVVLTLVLLTRAFRSVVLAVKAVVVNLVSVGATYGFLTLVWQQGHGSEAIWGVPATGSITNFVPLMVFAFLFGLSMDYEVFILARMRESYDAHGSTSRAVVEGLGRTGKLVTSAALILFLSFLSLSQTPQVDIKILATALGGGILLDATVVRALLVPALVSLLGRWNWWLPPGLARLLLLPPSTGPAPGAGTARPGGSGDPPPEQTPTPGTSA